MHKFLSAEGEDDVSLFGPLYTAYRSWFVDVGIERSAHVLDRVVRLLHADEQPYKVSGARKDYPRAVLVRRANVYHTQRLRHNAAPRPRSDLDEELLMDLIDSSISLYTEVRRNAQSAGEADPRIHSVPHGCSARFLEKERLKGGSRPPSKGLDPQILS